MRSLSRFVALAGLVLALVPLTGHQPQAQAAVANTPWPMYRQNPQHTARTSVLAPQVLSVKWRYGLTARSDSSPAIGPDGTIYFGADDGSVYALNPNGTLKWRVNPEDNNSKVYSPAVDDRGHVLVSVDKGILFALRQSDGSVDWKVTHDADIKSSPGIGPDGSIYVGTENGAVIDLYPDGSRRFTRRATDAVRGAPAVGPDGTIYWASRDRRVYAGNPAGGDKWSVALDGEIVAAPAVDSDNTVYIGTRLGSFYAIRDGAIRWRVSVGAAVEAPAAIGPDAVYVGTLEGRVLALNKDGGLLWSFGPIGQVVDGPVIAGDGTIYVPSLDNRLYVLSPTGQRLGDFSTGGGIASSPVIGADGTIYVTSREQAIYALGGQRIEVQPTPTPTPPAVAPTPTPIPTVAPPAPRITDPVPPAPGARYFPETGHNVRGRFLEVFDQYGGLYIFGYPRTEELQEEVDGVMRTVQYFQRARMELWPEFAGTPYEVQLTLLGDLVLRQRGQLP